MLRQSQPVDGHHPAFIEWATSEKGVELRGIVPKRTRTSGIGIAATRDIVEGERVMFVPAQSLLTVQSPLVKALKLPRDCTVHGKLAAALTVTHADADRSHRLWEATWPSREEMQGFPMLWKEKFTDLLPKPAKALLEKQRAKVAKDRKALAQHVDEKLLDGDLFVYYWLLVNSRCFYWDYPDVTTGRRPAKRRKTTLPTDECMALCPVADYFNHRDIRGCRFESDATGCWVTADRSYRADEELFISYGRHGNDMLLVEYGFTLRVNDSDCVKLDDYLLPRFSEAQKQILKTHRMLGDYSMFGDTEENICYRTEAALRALVLPEARWERFLAGTHDGVSEQHAVGIALNTLLADFERDIKKAMRQVKWLEECEEKHALSDRWSQMADIVYHPDPDSIIST